CRRQRSITLPEIWYLRLAAPTDNSPDSTSWTICCLNPASNFRRCFPIDRLLLRVHPTRPLSRSHPPQILTFSLQSMGRSPVLASRYRCVIVWPELHKGAF